MSEDNSAAVIQLHLEGKLTEAEQGYRALIHRGTAPAAIYGNLAAICIASGRIDEGFELLRAALRLSPQSADSHHNLGVALQRQGQLDEAIVSYRRAIQLNPSSYGSHYDLGALLTVCERYDEAATAMRQAILLKPDAHDAHCTLGLILKKQGKLDESAAIFLRAIVLRPGTYNAYAFLSEVQVAQGKPDDATATLRKAIARDPGNHRAYVDAAAILRNNVKLDEAAACLRKAIEIIPEDAESHCNLGVIFLDQRRLREAIDSFQRAIQIKPVFAQAHSNLIYAATAGQIYSPAELLRLSRRFETEICATSTISENMYRRISTDGKIKIAFLSAEIGHHPVSYFLESYLSNYDRRKFAISIYAINPRNDDKRDEIVRMVDHFVDVSAMTNDDTRRKIIDDGIDILIDTSGHTADNRLGVLARRSAPIQCHWIGFHAGTGVTAVDYFIGDNEVTPPEFDSHFSEKLVRLPNVWTAYSPLAGAPAPEQRSPTDHIALGCFNNLIKVGEGTLDLWSAVMTALPDATLLIKDVRCADEYSRNRIVSYLEARGVDRKRLTLIPRTASWHEHMALYNRIDIALDTTPLNGTTTTFDALFMGAPVVAMRGNWIGGRTSSSALKALGRPEWIAADTAQYVAIMTKLAANRQWLKGCKKTLRAEVLHSPLCDGKSLAAALENAFVRMIADHNAK